MARIAKSLVPPEQGYCHRDHRSKKGRKQGHAYRKQMKKKLAVMNHVPAEDIEGAHLLKKRATKKPKYT